MHSIQTKKLLTRYSLPEKVPSTTSQMCQPWFQKLTKRTALRLGRNCTQTRMNLKVRTLFPSCLVARSLKSRLVPFHLVSCPLSQRRFFHLLAPSFFHILDKNSIWSFQLLTFLEQLLDAGHKFFLWTKNPVRCVSRHWWSHTFSLLREPIAFLVVLHGNVHVSRSKFHQKHFYMNLRHGNHNARSQKQSWVRSPSPPFPEDCWPDIFKQLAFQPTQKEFCQEMSPTSIFAILQSQNNSWKKKQDKRLFGIAFLDQKKACFPDNQFVIVHFNGSFPSKAIFRTKRVRGTECGVKTHIETKNWHAQGKRLILCFAWNRSSGIFSCLFSTLLAYVVSGVSFFVTTHDTVSLSQYLPISWSAQLSFCGIRHPQNTGLWDCWRAIASHREKRSAKTDVRAFFSWDWNWTEVGPG